MTKDDGRRITISGINPITLNAGFYQIWNTSGMPAGIDGSSAYWNVDVLTGVDNTKQILAVLSSTGKAYLKNIHKNVDTGWKEITNNQTDTGWIPYTLINGVEGNTVYKNDIDNGFDCAYRIIKQGDITTRKLRVNARNLTQGMVFAELPNQFTKNTQTFLVRTPRNKNSAIVEIKADGKLIFQYYSNTTDWAETDYIYGEVTWHD